MKRILAFVLVATLLFTQLAMFPLAIGAQGVDGSPTSEIDVPPVTDEPAQPANQESDDVEAAAETPVIGGQVRVTTTLLNVRTTPSTGTVIATVPYNAVYTILDGPVAAGSYQWYQIDLPGAVDGWVASAFIEYIPGGAATSTPPIAPSATSTSAVPSGSIRVGDIVAVNTDVLNVRQSASTSATILRTVTQGQTFTVNGGPTNANGYTWVRLDLPGTDGWAVTQYLTLSSRPNPTNTATATVTRTPTVTSTSTVTRTATVTNTPSLTPTQTETSTATPTLTGSETATSTATNTATITSTATKTSTPNATATKAAGVYQAGDTIAVTSDLNVRSGPGTSNSVVLVAAPGTQGIVQTGNTPGGSYTWVQVKFGGTTGWVVTNYITHLSMATATPPASTGKITIALNCTTNPERIAITNDNTSAITIISIGTLYQPGSNEPFTLNQSLGAKQTRTYLSGSQASGTYRLTTSAILTDSAGTSEGVRVVTSAGTVTKNCPPASTADRWVEVDLSEQYMRVYQGTTLITGTYVSTGRYGFDTPVGTYRTWLRYTSQTMSGCIQGECYVVPNVPWVQYFTYEGHALHGAYWHNNFGTRMSHGCVNLPVPFAEWLYYWLPSGSRVVVKQ